MSAEKETGCGILSRHKGRVLVSSWRGVDVVSMTTEALFAERWKELESVTHLSFPTWDGREIEKFLKQMRVKGVDFTWDIAGISDVLSDKGNQKLDEGE